MGAIQRHAGPQPTVELLLARRAAAYHAAVASFDRIHRAALAAQHSRDLLATLHAALNLLEHQIAFETERAEVERPILREALEDLRIADRQVCDAGGRRLRDAGSQGEAGIWPPRFVDPRRLDEMSSAAGLSESPV